MVCRSSSIVCSSYANLKSCRYKKLLQTIDLRKDFFFSHSYHIMRSLQMNFSDPQEGWELYDTMFVWNEFLTRGIRNILKTTLWTVALVYGFFKQVPMKLISFYPVMCRLIGLMKYHRLHPTRCIQYPTFLLLSFLFCMFIIFACSLYWAKFVFFICLY